jgi:hypothetical protein
MSYRRLNLLCRIGLALAVLSNVILAFMPDNDLWWMSAVAATFAGFVFGVLTVINRHG